MPPAEPVSAETLTWGVTCKFRRSTLCPNHGRAAKASFLEHDLSAKRRDDLWSPQYRDVTCFIGATKSAHPLPELPEAAENEEGQKHYQQKLKLQ